MSEREPGLDKVTESSVANDGLSWLEVVKQTTSHVAEIKILTLSP